MLTNNILMELESYQIEYLESVDYDFATILQELKEIEKNAHHRMLNFKRKRLSEIKDEELHGGIEWRQEEKQQESLDPVNEIRKFRKDYAARFNYDFDLMLKDMQTKRSETKNYEKNKVADSSNSYSNRKKE